MAVVTEPPWVNQTSGVAARNGTTSHTISFGFTSTSGNFLAVLVFGAVTHTASGWTEQLQPVSSGELSVFTKTSAGDSSVSVTHNGSNYPVCWVAYEFPAGTTYVGGIGSTPTSDTFPTLTGLPGTEVTVIAARGVTIAGNATTGDTTWTSPDVEDADSFTAFATTDGAYLGTGHRINVTATSFTPAATTTFGGAPATPDREHVVFALNVAAAGGGTTNGTAVAALSFTATASGTRTVQATAASTLAFAAAAAGVVTGGSGSVLGVAAANLAFASTATGIRTVLGAATAPFTFGVTATGTRTVRGVASAPFAFATSAASVRAVLGQALAQLTFSAAAAGGVSTPGSVVTRPNTGTVTRPFTGIVTRP